MLKNLIFFLLYVSLYGQITSVSTNYPHANDTIKVTYNTFTPSAKFGIKENVYMIIWRYDQDGEVFSSYKRMEVKSGLFNSEIIVGNNAAFYQLLFITLSNSSWDEKADLRILIYNKQNIPVRNAHCANIDFNNYNVEGNNELKLYPSNYSVYRSMWLNDTSKTKRERIRKEMIKLNTINTLEPSQELLCARAAGNLMLKNYTEALELTKELVLRYPRKRDTYRILQQSLSAIDIHNFPVDTRLKIIKLARNYVEKNPDLSSVWDLIASYNFSIFSDSCIKNTSLKWMALQNDNPEPYYFACISCFELGEYKTAEKYGEKGLDLVLCGNLRLYSDVSGKKETMILAELYYEVAQIKFKLHEFSKALEAIKASQSLLSFAGAFQLEGDIWFALKNYNTAEKAYLESFKNGDLESKKKILQCYEQTHNSLKGFEKYFEFISTTDSLKSTESDMAPDFNVTGLNNIKYSLEKLKGKIIVMNFWFTGCLPCKTEIPDLNSLALRYQNSNVIFLAFALDDSATLKRYLKDNVFRYIIIPNSSSVAGSYKIKYYPSHIIIDQTGSILSRILGAGQNISQRLSQIINSQLREKQTYK